jgi:CheY-like chemotaxis protein
LIHYQTGFSQIIDAEQAAALGINAFLLKPWTVRELARTIAQVLAQQRA